jgi:hemolysin III
MSLAIAAKPRMRGVLHQYAIVPAAAAGIVLVLAAPSGRARLAVGIYALTLLGLFSVSALYHRIDWRPRARAWMRRADHSMIFLFMAGAYTPFALLAFSQPFGTISLIVVWALALAGGGIKIAWISAPKWFAALLYVGLGWAGVVALPQMLNHVGAGATVLFLAGGLVYSVGAGVYAREWPNPWPGTFGYHEVFHVLVIVAAALHYAAIAGYVLPGS